MPKRYTFKDMVKVLNHFGYYLECWHGSHATFINRANCEDKICMARAHGRYKYLAPWNINKICKHLGINKENIQELIK